MEDIEQVESNKRPNRVPDGSLTSATTLHQNDAILLVVFKHPMASARSTTKLSGGAP